jgi:hypothetical protein
MRKKKLLWMIPVGIVALAAFIAIGGQIVMLLWNWLVPAIIGWKLITFWQAVGLLALCRILFGRHGGGFGRFRDRRREMRERWEKMTPEEREKLRQGWRGRCGFRAPASEGNESA